MNTLVLLSILAGGPAPLPELGVVFQPDPGRPGPSLVVHLEERSGGRQAARVALLGGAEPRWVEAVEQRPGAPGRDHPVGPERASLVVAGDGALLLTLRGLSGWQRGLEDARRGGIRGEGVPVADADTLRLTVAPPTAECAEWGCAWSAAARAVGTRASVEGVAWVRRGKPRGVVVSDGREARPTSATVLAVPPTCKGRAVDVAVSLEAEADVRLWARDDAALCAGWTVSLLDGELRDERARTRSVRAVAIR